MSERRTTSPSQSGELTVTVGDSESIELDVDADETIVLEWEPHDEDEPEVATDGGEGFEHSTEIVSLRGHRSPDGDLNRVTLHSILYVYESEELVDDERASLEYDVIDGDAELAHIEEADPPGFADADAGIKPGILRTLPAAEEAVQNIPGVDQVEPASVTLGRPIDIRVKQAGDRDA